MEIQKDYRVFTDRIGFNITGYGVSFTIKNDKGCSENVFNVKHLYSPDLRWIDVENLLSEDYLKKNKIDYLLNSDNLIIPLGLVDFNNNYGECDLNVCTHNLKTFDVFEQIVEDIEKAIKTRCQGYKFKNMIVNKARSGEIDKIPLD